LPAINLNSGAAHPELREKLRGESLTIHPDSIFITENRYRQFNERDLGGLMDSIRQVGLLQPIGVKHSNDPDRFGLYEVVYGRRRAMAMKRLYGEAVARSQDPNNDNEVFRFSSIWVIRFPKSMPDHLVKMLEIKENLDRKELTSNERTACLLEMGVVLREAGISEDGNIHETHEYSEAPKNGRGRPKKPVAETVSQETGVDRGTLKSRLKNASDDLGLDKPLDLDETPVPVMVDAAQQLRALDQVEAEKKEAKGPRLNLNIYPHDPSAFIVWLRKRHPEQFSLDDLRAYRDALISLVAELTDQPLEEAV
jgi:hypothetical protein